MPIKQEYVLKEDLCVTQDGSRVVPCGDRDGYFLLGRKGQVIDRLDAVRFGLLNPDGSEPKSETEKKSVKSDSTENKAVSAKAVENKAVKSAESK